MAGDATKQLTIMQSPSMRDQGTKFSISLLFKESQREVKYGSVQKKRMHFEFFTLLTFKAYIDRHHKSSNFVNNWSLHFLKLADNWCRQKQSN